MPIYEVTCSFDGTGQDSPGRAVARSRETLRSLRANGVEITQEAATVRRDSDVVRLELRYSASAEGIVGWQTYRAGLPVSGIRRLD